MKILTSNTERIFVPAQLELNNWTDIAPLYEELLNAEINSTEELNNWLRKRSELEAFVSEDMGKRYIAMTCNTADVIASEKYQHFVQTIQPELSLKSNLLDEKLLQCKYRNERKDKAFEIYLKGVEVNARMFRKENIPLFTELSNLAQEFAVVSGGMEIEWEGKKLTLQQASLLLLDNDRNKRKEVYEKIRLRRLKDQDKLQELMSKMVELRHKAAQQAGYNNFRDYMFDSLHRFDYTPNDCVLFHESVKKHIVPLLKKLDQQRKEQLKTNDLRPYDMDVDPEGLPPLKPFENQQQLIEKTLKVFSQLDPYFADCLFTMKESSLLDLESRTGKAPGGYLYPLPLSGVPFIFMNAVGSLNDVVTMVHEGGHAIHSFLSRDLELNDFKNVPSEVAELASMSMELMSMQNWKVFFADEKEMKRAKMEKLDDVLRTLPWVAAIDEFQHWMYTNPNHTATERNEQWAKIYDSYSTGEVNWNGLEDTKTSLWQKQLHLYEVPFYYIEYGFAQLGAVAMWRQFLQSPENALSNYKKALSLGYTVSIPEIYKAGGISFRFDDNYVSNLSEFIQEHLN